MSVLKADAASELTRGQYEELAGVSRSQAAYDLAELVEAGLLERVGNGRATRYRLAREGGAQRHWTSERIRSELEGFCSGRKVWPSAADFKEAGRGDLYVAASRYGGIGHWAEVLGVPRSPRSASPAPERSPLGAKLAWAGGGALAVLAVGAVVFATTHHGAAPAASPRHGVLSARASNESSRPAHSTRRAQPEVQRRVQRQHAHHRAAARSRPPGSSQVRHSSSRQQSSVSAVAATRTFDAVNPAPSGPTPLPAPSGSAPPNPLKGP